MDVKQQANVNVCKLFTSHIVPIYHARQGTWDCKRIFNFFDTATRQMGPTQQVDCVRGFFVRSAFLIEEIVTRL